MKLKTVIGFDSWTEGSHHYVRLVSELKKVGINLKLIHIGSWGHDQGRPVHELIDDLPVYDISYYGNKDLIEVLKLENPAAIIFLSTQAYVHRAVNRYASLLNIPTLHLYHGLIAVQAVETGHPDHISFFPQAKMIADRFWKNITKLLPVYIKSLIDTSAGAGEWFDIIKDSLTKLFGRYVEIAAKDSETQYCAVYTSADIEHAHIKYHVRRENIRVVGNPDLIKFGLSSNDFHNYYSVANSMKKIMYIDHGGSTCALNFMSVGAFVDFLEYTNLELKKQGYSLIVKMHPSQNNTRTPELTKDKGIQLSSDTSFLDDLRCCCAAIVGPSTASLIPALMGLPLMLAQYGPFEGQKYGKVLLAYPRAILLKNIIDAQNMLFKESEGCDQGKVFNWINENAGPLPAEKMPERVAGIVAEMISVKTRQEFS